MAPLLRHLARPDFDEFAAATGERMRERVLREWGPEKFWHKVCNG